MDFRLMGQEYLDGLEFPRKNADLRHCLTNSLGLSETNSNADD
jgi:hypothetical protein